jgi:integrase
LTLGPVQELRAYVGDWGGRPWVDLTFCVAAYTGARRSGILRSRVDDFDAGVITIRENKRDRPREITFRSVPISARLRQVLRTWLQLEHPRGPCTICGHGRRPLTRQRMTKEFRSAVVGSRL